MNEPDDNIDRPLSKEQMDSIINQTYLDANDIEKIIELYKVYDAARKAPLWICVNDVLDNPKYREFVTNSGLELTMELRLVKSLEHLIENPYCVFDGKPVAECVPEVVQDIPSGKLHLLLYYDYYHSDEERRIAVTLKDSFRCQHALWVGAPDSFHCPDGSERIQDHDQRRRENTMTCISNGQKSGRHRISSTHPIQDKILNELGAEVLCEREDGTIRVFSGPLRKSSDLRLSRTKRIDAIQAFGENAQRVIVDKEADLEDTFTMRDVNEALALEAAHARGRDNERGVGIWQGSKPNTIVLANNTEGAVWDGKQFRLTLRPRVDGLVLDFGAGSSDWYDFYALSCYVPRAFRDPWWCRDVILEAVDLFSRWRFKNDAVDPELVVGLVLASYVQAIWAWRPLVSVIGESNSGKSFLFECLGGSDLRPGLFGKLAAKQSKSTAAGIRQDIANTSKIILCDEFESSRQRQETLEMFRLSSRGDQTHRGTSDQRGRTYRLRHIPWVAAIESGLDRQPDVNRFIQLELLPAESHEQGQLRLPESEVLESLGLRLLAIAVAHAISARELACRLKSVAVAGVDSRTVESFAVPTAILASAEGFCDAMSKGKLAWLLRNVDRTEQGQTDHEDLLDAILGLPVYCGPAHGQLAISQVLDSDALYKEFSQRVEASGVKLDGEGLDGEELFIAHKQVTTGLSKLGKWDGQRIDQILCRIRGARKDVRKRIAGQYRRGITIPWPLSQP